MGRAPTLPLSAAEIGFPEISDAEDLEVWTPQSKAVTATYSSLPPLLKPCASLRSTTFHWTARLSTLEDRILTSMCVLTCLFSLILAEPNIIRQEQLRPKGRNYLGQNGARSVGHTVIVHSTTLSPLL